MLAGTAALAQQPLVGLHVYGLGDGQNAEAAAGLGGGLEVGFRAAGPLWLELNIEAGWDRALDATAPLDRWRLGLAPGLRLFLTPRSKYKVAPSLAVRGGTDLGPDRVDVLVGGDVALDIFVDEAKHWAVRLEAGALTRNLPLVAGRGGIAVVWSPPKKAPPPPQTPDGVWWPYPHCAWIDGDEAHAWLEDRDRARGLSAAGATGSAVVQDGEGEQEGQGSLFVAGFPGDLVTIDDATSRTAPDGVAAWVAKDGVVNLVVTGGGRRVERSATLAQGYATWVRVPPPKPVVIGFDLGSAVVRPEVRDQLLLMAQTTGAWRWELHGSYSPEGADEKNAALADERARAVAAVLVAAGLPIDAVVVGPGEPPADGVRPEQQRVVRCLPIPPEASP